jgi:hypothetical protein
MNILETVRNQAGGRLVLLLVATLLFGIAANVVALPPIVYILCALVASPAVIGVAAYFWTTAAEWTKLAVAEKYSQAAYEQMQQAQQADLRASLDMMGQEALDELNAAIERRDQSREDDQ